MTDTRRLPRTLVVRLDSAGDVLLAGPAVRAVAAGSSHTAMLCGPRGVQAAKLLPGVDEVLEYDAPWVGLEPAPVSRAATRQLLQTLTAGCFDRALVLVSYHQSPLPIALLLKLAGVGWTAADSEDYPGALLDLRHRRLPHRHEAVAALDLARDAGFALPPGDEGALRVTTPPDTTHLTGSEPYVVLHPGATVPARAWSPERAARAAAALAAEGYRVVVTGGRGERELTAKVAGSHGLDLVGLTDLRQLAGVLAGARVAVVGNTGPAHLAAAVGTPVASLFAPVVPAERWAPYGVPHVLLGDQSAACAATRARHCPVPGHPCLDGVSDAEVLAAVAALCEGRPTAMHDADRTRKTVRTDLATDASPGPGGASGTEGTSGPEDVTGPEDGAKDVPGPEDVSGPGRGPETERGATV
jgi:ADP-heptose:LPS heptosyltransferase